MRAVVVAGHRQHAAMRRSADEIAAMQRIAGAIDAGAFAVPHAEHAIDALAGKRVELLRAIQHGRREVLVDAGLEADVLGQQHCLAAPEFLIEPAQRRSAIAGNQPAGVQAGGTIEPGLFQQHADERLDAGQQHRRVEIGEAAFECGAGGSGGTGRGEVGAETDIHLGSSLHRAGGILPFPALAAYM